MLKKIVALLVLATVTFNVASAQRDFRRERAELARQEKEERRRSRSERVNIDYGTNMLRLSPFTAMDLGVGFGLSYEKILGSEQMIGLILPFYVILDGQNDFDPVLGGSGTNNNTSNAYFYFNPGLKIYPFGQRRVTYAVGPSLLLGSGGGTEWRYNNIGVEEQNDITKLRLGMLVNNYVNFQITKGFNLGIEVGLGALYIDRETIDRPNMPSMTYNNGINVTGSFSLTLGYRF